MATTTDTGSVPLSYGARRIAERALEYQRKLGHEKLGVNHWLLALLERHGPMAESLAEGLEASTLRRQIRDRLNNGDPGEAIDLAGLVERTTGPAAGGAGEANERSLASAILSSAGYSVREPAAASDLDVTSSPAGRAGSTPMLDEFGRDLTREAREGKLPPVVGREDEIREVCRTLCRRTKRNPALIGPAGTGKTAIVEGLAQRIAAGNVPEALKGARIVALQPSSLVAGAGVVGELEKRMKALVEEASREGVILFIDELHSIMGSGGMVGRGDVGAQLKPALGRGEVSCIGATTDDEYRRYIEPDRALERRFRPIAVEEMSPEETRVVLAAHRDLLSKLRGVEIPDEVLDWLVAFAADFLRNRSFPDKAVDLLEQCVATAVMDGTPRVDLEQARRVAQEMVGMPVDLEARLGDLEKRIAESALLGAEEAEDLLDRLAITMRGLDLRPARPNVVVLLAGAAAEVGEELAEGMAQALLGDAKRVVEIDFGQFDHDEDVNTLLGAPPAYIGFEEHLPLHDLARMPWSALVCKNVDGCHPQVLEILAQALADGYFTERSGKRIYLSDALVVLTAPSGAAAKAPPGIYPPGRGGSTPEGPASLEKLLGPRLVEQVDVVSMEGLTRVAERQGWVERTLLPGLSDQYREKGLALEWAPSFLSWVREQQRAHPSRVLLTRLVERHLGDALIPHLPGPGVRGRARVEAQDGALRVVGGDGSKPAEEPREEAGRGRKRRSER